MKYQKSPSSCGPAAVVNALRCFGKRVSEYKVRSYTETTQEQGTNELGVMKAITSFGYSGVAFTSKKRTAGVTWLNYALSQGPVIICVDGWNHWLTVAGKCADRFIVIDSANTKNNERENGVHVYSRREIVRRWFNRNVNELYGIAISKK